MFSIVFPASGISAGVCGLICVMIIFLTIGIRHSSLYIVSCFSTCSLDLDQLLPLLIVTGGTDKELRLTAGENKCSGRVEVKVQEEWGTVCNNGWD